MIADLCSEVKEPAENQAETMIPRDSGIHGLRVLFLVTDTGHMQKLHEAYTTTTYTMNEVQFIRTRS